MEQGKPVISVIVPLYNAELYIGKCLDSILGQTYPNVEVIVVDDASTDYGGRLCEERAAWEKRLQVVHFAHNRGPSAARNEGVRRARGTYVSFVDADDSVEPDLLEKLYDNLLETGADISICGAYGIRQEDAPAGTFSRQEAIRCLARGCPFHHVPWGRLYPLELVRRCPFEEQIFYSEDLLFLYQLFQQVEKVSYLPDKLYHYTCREGSQVHSRVDRRKVTTLLVHELVCEDVASRYPEAEEAYRCLALEIDRCLAMLAVKNGTEGNIFACLKMIQKDVRRHFSLGPFTGLPGKKEGMAVLALYVSTVAFWVGARTYAFLKRGRGKDT